MGYGNPGGKSVVSKVPNTTAKAALGNNTIQAKTTVTSSSPLLVQGKNMSYAKQPMSSQLLVDIIPSILCAPTRTPGGAGINMSPLNPPKANSPGFVSTFLTNAANNTYVEAGAPNTQNMYSNVGGNSMGLLETGKAALKSDIGKQILGGAVDQVTGGSKASATSTSRSVNPATGRSYRHMNSLNPRALSRATRRIASFTKRVHSVDKLLHKIARKRS